MGHLVYIFSYVLENKTVFDSKLELANLRSQFSTRTATIQRTVKKNTGRNVRTMRKKNLNDKVEWTWLHADVEDQRTPCQKFH